MKRLSVVGAIIGSFLLGAAMTAMAQEENKPEEHKQDAAPARQEPAKPEEHKNQEPKQDERQQPAQQDNRQMKPQEQQSQKMDKQQEKQQEKMEKQQGREQERQQQSRPAQPMQGGQAQGRPQHVENKRHISDSDFHAHFGREHRFAPGRMQVVSGRPQFAYGGYQFELIEVWPTDWAYDADDYYVDYFDDEYWLCSFSHPDVRLELVIIG